MRNSTIAIAAVLSLSLVSATATAQPDTSAASAEQLFREGKRLMQAGNIAEACIAFEGSYRKDAAASTLVNLADCREQNQQYATAWGQFVEAARQTRDKPDQSALYAAIQKRVAALEPKLSYLTINVPDTSRLSGLAITKNGTAVDTAEWNVPLPADGGEYIIEGKAPGREAWSTSVKVAPSKDNQSVTVPRFRDTSTTSGATTTGPHRSGMRTKRKAAIGLWAVGAASLGGGLLLELSARSTYDDAKTGTVYAEQQDLWHSANHKRVAAQVVAGVGVAAVGLGAYLWFTGKPIEHAGVAFAPQLGSDFAGIAISGRM